MQPDVVARLLALNRDFYDRFALAFARTRGAGQAGLRRALPYLPAAPRVLDIGCGNGRLAHFLAGQRPGLTFVGVDDSEPLLDVARGSVATLPGVTADFILADVTRPGWETSVPAGAYDAVYLLGLLHHLPGFDLRRDLLRSARRLVAQQGVLVVSYWQFPHEPRLHGRVVSWSLAGIDPADTDAGDALLDWRRDGHGVRYVHHVDEAEAARLARGAGWRVLDTTYADGRGGRSNLFQICRPDSRIVSDRP